MFALGTDHWGKAHLGLGVWTEVPTMAACISGRDIL